MTMSSFDPIAVRQTLTAELARIQTRLQALATSTRSEPGARPGFGKRVGDYTAEVMEGQRAQATARTLRQAAAEIERALAKLDEGTYGRCDVCQAPIDAERLAALPAATLCVPCKSKTAAPRHR